MQQTANPEVPPQRVHIEQIFIASQGLRADLGKIAAGQVTHL